MGEATTDLSLVPKTEEEAYKQKLYKRIGARWYLSVEQNQTLLQAGKVTIKFYVHADGTIDQLSVKKATRRVDVLQTLSLKSVEKASGTIEPFSDSLREKWGDGFWDEIDFMIYDDKRASVLQTAPDAAATDGKDAPAPSAAPVP